MQLMQRHEIVYDPAIHTKNGVVKTTRRASFAQTNAGSSPSGTPFTLPGSV